jgi:hypothetical protein
MGHFAREEGASVPSDPPDFRASLIYDIAGLAIDPVLIYWPQILLYLVKIIF